MNDIQVVEQKLCMHEIFSSILPSSSTLFSKINGTAVSDLRLVYDHGQSYHNSCYHHYRDNNKPFFCREFDISQMFHVNFSESPPIKLQEIETRKV